MDIVAGSVVKSKAGKDKGEFFVVVSLDGDRVSVCDGKSRGLSNPKRKNPRHLAVTSTVIDLPITDKQLRITLKNFSEVTKED